MRDTAGRRQPWIAAAMLAAAGVLVVPGGRAAAQQSAIPRSPDDRTIQHVLNRLGFGARPGDVDRVRRMGLAVYIDQQLHPERLPDPVVDAQLARLTTLTLSARQLTDEVFTPARMAQAAARQQQGEGGPRSSPQLMAARRNEQRVLGELMQARLLRAIYSERQLNEVLVDFWFNHFNVFMGKGAVRQYLSEYERDVIRPHVFGRFRDLLGAVAHSPAMLFYLDNWQSAAPAAATASLPPQAQRRLNDPRLPASQRQQLLERMEQQRRRPARGLNENYGRELLELHTLGVDGGYTQKDVVEVARALTGWTIDRPQQGGGFVFRAAMHDAGEKVILGRRFPAGRGEDEGERVLDLLAGHPSTSRHIAFKLAQRLVADDPPAALVGRAARVFRDTKGDLREVVRAIVTSPEFFAPAAYRAKVKTPLEFVVSAVRVTGADVVNAEPVAQLLRTQLGMPLYGCQPPTGYSTTADAWVNTGALLNRMNAALQLVGGQARWIRLDAASAVPEMNADAPERVVQRLLGGDASDGTRQVLAKAQDAPHLLALALGSPEFQRR